MNATKLSGQFKDELTQNILPFWMTHAVDQSNGGLHGSVANDLQIDNRVPRSAILAARVLWTFSAAYGQLKDPAYLAMAKRQFEDLKHTFWDPQHGGLYWLVDRRGVPVSDRKHHYAQAFGIYGLSAFYHATANPESLDLAQHLFDLLERHAFDPIYGGYFEGSTREWRPLEDARLSDKDLNSKKSMNTMLHLLEAYTSLLRVWDNAQLREQLGAIIRNFTDRIIDRSTGHMRLFFDASWRSLNSNISFGHDIEASWLLQEAAEVNGNPCQLEHAKQLAVLLANAVVRDGLGQDGSLFSESSPQGMLDEGKDWWPQAEAVVGFHNAYELTDDASFADAAFRCWRYIQEEFVDRTHGDWFKRLDLDGIPDPQRHKSGPWECPYHHGRMCLEMLRRLESTREDAL